MTRPAGPQGRIWHDAAFGEGLRAVHAMRSFLLPFGRLAPRAFAAAVIVLYVAGLFSQMLLAAPVTARLGLWPFAAAQAVLLWLWFAVHANRLRDAGRSIGAAAGIACLYGLAVILLILVLAVFGEILHEPDWSGFGLILLAFLVLILIPISVAIGFSIATGLRASVPAS